MEGQLKEQEEKFTEAGNQYYNWLTNMQGSVKKKKEQIGEIPMKNLLHEIQDSKREMGVKLNQALTKTKSYAQSVQNATTSEKNQTSIETNIVVRANMVETKNAELIEGVEESSRVNKDDAIKSDDVFITKFTAA